MKILERKILQFQESIFFSAIRDKIDYVRVVVHASRILLLNFDSEEIPSDASLKLIVDKMSRLFFYKENKFFSISFPFTVTMSGNDLTEMSTYSGKKLDNKGISAILSVIDDPQFIINPSLVDFAIDSNNIDFAELAILEEILQFEPSYIRFDNDLINQKGNLHPVNHFDINYSHYSSYKLGLQNLITREYFENMQNTNTDCCFVTDP